MPPNVVKTERDERLWEEAKRRAREEYPNVKEGTDQWYAIVMGIFRRMKYRTGSKEPPPPKSKQKTSSRRGRLVRAYLGK